jgi:hypothetical protein
VPLYRAAAPGRVALCAWRCAGAHAPHTTNTNATQKQKKPNPPAPQRSHPAPTHGHHRASPIPTPPEIKPSNFLAGFEARQPLLHPWEDQDRKIPPTTETTSRTTAPTSRGPRRWGGNPATPNASSGHPPTRKTDFLLALTFSARHAALLAVLAVQPALVVVVGAARATAPVADLGWVPGLVSRHDGQYEALGEAYLLCRGRQARAGEPLRGPASRPARSTRS